MSGAAPRVATQHLPHVAKDLDEAELGGPITWKAPADLGLYQLTAAMFAIFPILVSESPIACCSGIPAFVFKSCCWTMPGRA